MRAGPTIAATTGAGQAVDLTWSGADTSPWSPAPAVAYRLVRGDGATMETIATDLAELQYTDAAVTPSATYTYEVDAVVRGGTARHSAPLTVVAGAANQPLLAVGTLPDLPLRAGAGPHVVDVAGAFSDLDDALTYAAASSAPTWRL